MSRAAELLHRIKPHAEWYSEDGQGAIQLKAARLRLDNCTYVLSTAARVALALTELCCERKKGKIYLLVPHCVDNRGKARFEAVEALRGVPELFYVLESWSEEDQTAWMAMTPDDRLHRLSCRHGWLGKEASVLPFALECHENQLRRPQFDALQRALVTVLISPIPYVAFTEQMRQECNGPYFDGGNRAKPTRCIFIGKDDGWHNFEQWRVHGGRGVLDWLERVYCDGCGDLEECVTFYGALVKGLIEAGQTAAEAEQPYALLGEPSK